MKGKTVNNIEPNNTRLLETLEIYAGELTEKVELVRTLGNHLISLALQGDIDYPVEWRSACKEDLLDFIRFLRACGGFQIH
jgi:hypothetical protein